MTITKPRDTHSPSITDAEALAPPHPPNAIHDDDPPKSDRPHPPRNVYNRSITHGSVAKTRLTVCTMGHSSIRASEHLHQHQLQSGLGTTSEKQAQDFNIIRQKSDEEQEGNHEHEDVTVHAGEQTPGKTRQQKYILRIAGRGRVIHC